MITLITGTPGNGKTALGIDLVWFQKSIWHDLDKYVDGVGELQLPHFDFPALSEVKDQKYQPLSQVDSEEYAVWNPSNPLYTEFTQARAAAKYPLELWYLWAQPNSVIFIDEAQRYFRPRPAGSRVPLYVQLLEYHRHFGIHFVLITQKERLVDSNVRMLTGQHMHITNSWQGRRIYEWSEVKDSDSKTEKQVAAATKYKLPKHVFPLYKSAVSHLKVSHKTPFFFYLMIGSVLLVPVLAYLAYSSYKKNHFPEPVSAGVISPAVAVTSSGAVSGVPVVSAVSSVSPMQASIDKFSPVVPGRPETAPAFDELRRVSVMPMVSACMSTASNCKCYTQQGTAVADMTVESCRAYLEQGRHFNPYAQAVGQASNPPASAFRMPSDANASTVEQRLVNAPVSAREVGAMVASR